MTTETRTMKKADLDTFTNFHSVNCKTCSSIILSIFGSWSGSHARKLHGLTASFLSVRARQRPPWGGLCRCVTWHCRCKSVVQVRVPASLSGDKLISMRQLSSRRQNTYYLNCKTLTIPRDSLVFYLLMFIYMLEFGRNYGIKIETRMSNETVSSEKIYIPC